MTRNESKEGCSIKNSALAVIASALLAASLAGCATTGDFDGSASAEMPVDHGTAAATSKSRHPGRAHSFMGRARRAFPSCANTRAYKGEKKRANDEADPDRFDG